MKRYALYCLCILSATTASAQTGSPIEGVWKVAEWLMPAANPGASGTSVTPAEPGLVIFTRGYYSQVVVRGEQPRIAPAPPKDPQNLTDAEKIALYEHWRPAIVNSGTYEVRGSTVTIRVIVAKNVQVISKAAPVEMTFKLDGPDTLWLIPPPRIASREPQTKYTRLE
jgi:hypothetical protein